MKKFICLTIILLSTMYGFSYPIMEDSSELRNTLLDLRQDFSDILQEVTQLRSDISNKDTVVLINYDKKVSQLYQQALIIDEQLTQLYVSLSEYERKLTKLTIINRILLVIMFVIVIGKAVGYYLYFKQIKLPKWFESIL